jgi:aminoglycoside phosphotransferase family enzyme/predicted kinase
MLPATGEDQAAVFELLEDPRTHDLNEPVKRVDTHGAAVFLAGPNVYKVKRAIRFPFMDFSTLERRRAACLAEIAVNRENAPTIYCDVVPITRDCGGLRLDGAGEIVEWAVHMHRFDENATLDHLAKKGPFGPEVTEKLARAIAASHARAPRRDGEQATRVLHRLLTETANELADYPDLFYRELRSAYAKVLDQAFAQLQPLLLRRGTLGQVRRCHGDLHLGNIVMLSGNPVLFDAIEFDEAIATTDILYDLAFLLMDLWQRGFRADANHLLNRYLSKCDDRLLQLEGLATLPLFMSMRAAIRAKVIAARARMDASKGQEERDAIGYFEAAKEFLQPAPTRLIAIGGLSGTGKSTLAAALAPFLGRAPGALHLRSDVERKQHFGVPETTRLSSEAYAPTVSQAIYCTIRSLAEVALRAGQVVLVDATYHQAAERQAIKALATRSQVPFLGIWLAAPTSLLKLRVTGRNNADASDATVAVVANQARESIGELTWHRVDASQNLEGVKKEVLKLMK